MSSSTFDRETLLDLVVNAIPLGIILFFIVVFVVLNPFGSAPVQTALQFTIMIAMFVGLGLLTYISGRAISNAEKELEEHRAELATADAAEPDAGVAVAADGESDEEDEE